MRATPLIVGIAMISVGWATGGGAAQILFSLFGEMVFHAGAVGIGIIWGCAGVGLLIGAHRVPAGQAPQLQRLQAHHPDRLPDPRRRLRPLQPDADYRVGLRLHRDVARRGRRQLRAELHAVAAPRRGPIPRPRLRHDRIADLVDDDDIDDGWPALRRCTTARGRSAPCAGVISSTTAFFWWWSDWRGNLPEPPQQRSSAGRR